MLLLGNISKAQLEFPKSSLQIRKLENQPLVKVPAFLEQGGNQIVYDFLVVLHLYFQMLENVKIEPSTLVFPTDQSLIWIKKMRVEIELVVIAIEHVPKMLEAILIATSQQLLATQQKLAYLLNLFFHFVFVLYIPTAEYASCQQPIRIADIT